ncbi:MAG: hypothetical protein H6707_16920 [Deltaproteobacteria bacterium]|nr:hypothetical protein [Deltaproteobacteria bacterium]
MNLLTRLCALRRATLPTERTPRQKRRQITALIVAAGLLTATALAEVWTNLRVIDLGYRISQATSERARLTQINRKLKVEFALLKRPERIGQLAEKWGWKPPAPQQIRTIDTKSKVLVASRPTPESE